jgi:hypothetical protein
MTMNLTLRLARRASSSFWWRLLSASTSIFPLYSITDDCDNNGCVKKAVLW